MNFVCRYTRSRLSAFVRGEVGLKARRRIARHLDECSACYGAYVRQRDLEDELARRIETIGQPTTPQLRRMWSAIERDLTPPETPRPRYQRRYGLVALALMIALLFPWTLGNQNVPFLLPSQPMPSLAATMSAGTPDSRAAHRSPVAVALRATDGNRNASRVTLWNTPEPTDANLGLEGS